jgi:hypothetical protein
VPNVSQVAASDVGDDPAVKTFTQNVQKVQDEITALKAELVVAKAGMNDAALPEDKAMFRSDVTRINTEIERLGRKEELLLQLMLEKMKQVKEAKDAAKKAADLAVQSEMTEADKNDRILGELRHSDIDTLVCWRAWSAAMPLVTGTGGGAGRKSVSFWTCSCQREIIDYPSTTCKCVRDCPYVSDRYLLSFILLPSAVLSIPLHCYHLPPTPNCISPFLFIADSGVGPRQRPATKAPRSLRCCSSCILPLRLRSLWLLFLQIVTVKHSTLWQHPKYFFHKAPPRPINVTEAEKPAVKTVKKSWGQINPEAAGDFGLRPLQALLRVSPVKQISPPALPRAPPRSKMSARSSPRPAGFCFVGKVVAVCGACD